MRGEELGQVTCFSQRESASDTATRRTTTSFVVPHVPQVIVAASAKQPRRSPTPAAASASRSF